MILKTFALAIILSFAIAQADEMTMEHAASGSHPNAANTAFQQISSLAGKWKGPEDATLTYTLTANGTAVMEVMKTPKEPPMITMYTVDGDHLLATHYCSLGNQPQMATGTITDTSSKPLRFSLVRVTGLKNPNDWHNTGLKVFFEDEDHFTQEWSYQYKGKSGTSTFHFTRTER